LEIKKPQIKLPETDELRSTLTAVNKKTSQEAK
jgi:hypothetical protein